MKKYIYLAVSLILFALTGCENRQEVVIEPTALLGRWSAPSQRGEGHFVFVFTNEDCIVDGMNYGKWCYQFDEGDNVTEEDVLVDYHKNGWAGYVINNDIIQLNNMGEFGFDGTTTNRVKAFSTTKMTMVDAGKTYVMTKAVLK